MPVLEEPDFFIARKASRPAFCLRCSAEISLAWKEKGKGERGVGFFFIFSDTEKVETRMTSLRTRSSVLGIYPAIFSLNLACATKSSGASFICMFAKVTKYFLLTSETFAIPDSLIRGQLV